MAQGGSVLRTLLALGVSFALAACASSSRVEEGATPAVEESAMVAAAAEKTGGAAIVVPAPATKAKAEAAKPVLPKPDSGKAEAAPVVATVDAATANATAANAATANAVIADNAGPLPAQAKNVNLTRAPPVEIPTPKQLIGLNRDEVQSLLGFPWLLKREGTAELWQYRVTSCVLDLLLLGPDQDGLKVSHVELRSRRENKPPTAACYRDILNTPRPAPNQTAKGLSQPSS
jgi:hypothetical protein